jgi:hypothetical protein
LETPSSEQDELEIITKAMNDPEGLIRLPEFPLYIYQKSEIAQYPFRSSTKLITKSD